MRYLVESWSPEGNVELSGAISAVASVSGRLTVMAPPDEAIVMERWESGLTSMWRYEGGRPVDWDGDLHSDA